MLRIRAHRTSSFIVLLLLAVLADGLNPRRPNLITIGWRSALAHHAAIPVNSAAAFSGGLPMPPQRWHHSFFRRVGLTRLVPTERRKQSSAGDRSEVRLFGKRLVEGIRSTIADTTCNSEPNNRVGIAEVNTRPLTFFESMTCGAISRSVSQTLTHPANAMKTMLQSNRDGSVSIATLVRRENIHALTRGAGAQFVLSLPQGAVNFAVLEYTKKLLNDAVERSKWGSIEKNGAVAAGLDFLSSAASTVCCLVVSGPITIVTDNIMAGNYPNLNAAVSEIARQGGVNAFYSGWRPQLVSKIPSYGVTWVLFQRLKEAHNAIFHRPPSDVENLMLGSIASGATVSIMMPLDTIKTRLITQASNPNVAAAPYRGITDCAVRIIREEGPSSLYRGISPRLASVVPMVAIQFGVYEFMKRKCLKSASAIEEQKQQYLLGGGGTKIAKN